MLPKSGGNTLGLVIQGRHDPVTARHVIRSVYELRYHGNAEDIAYFLYTDATNVHLANILPHTVRNGLFRESVVSARAGGNAVEPDTTVRPSLPPRSTPYPATEVAAETVRNTAARMHVAAQTSRNTAGTAADAAATAFYATPIWNTQGTFNAYVTGVATTLRAHRPLLRVKVSDFHFADSGTLNTNACRVELVNQAGAAVSWPFWCHYHPTKTDIHASFKSTRGTPATRLSLAPLLATTQVAADVELLRIVLRLMSFITPDARFVTAETSRGGKDMKRTLPPATYEQDFYVFEKGPGGKTVRKTETRTITTRTAETYTGCVQGEVKYSWGVL